MILEENGQEVDFYRMLEDEMKPVIEMSIKAVELKLNP